MHSRDMEYIVGLLKNGKDAERSRRMAMEYS